MANSYAGNAFDIDTDVNVAGLVALKGGAVAGTDSIFVYNGATLTVEQALACLLISLGETSAGAAPAGQRVGHFVQNAGTTVTATGVNATSGSGLQINPASAAAESLGCSVAFNGTLANPCVWTNSAGGYDATKRYIFLLYYGVIAAWSHLSIRYAVGVSAGLAVVLPLRASISSSTAVQLGTWTYVTGDASTATVYVMAPRYGIDLPFDFGRLTIDASARTSNGTVGAFIHNSNACGAVSGNCKVIKGTGNLALVTSQFYEAAASSADMYFRTRFSNSVDIRQTETVPTGLAVANPAPTADGELAVTWTNAASYAAGDELVVYNAADDAVLAILDATVGSGRICGLTNATAYTVYAKATSDNYIFSDATANVGPTTCTGTDTPAVNNTHLSDTVRGVTGTLQTPISQLQILAGDLAGNPQALFLPTDTVYVGGWVESVKALAAANVRIQLFTSAGVLISTPLNAAYNFLANVSATIDAINGGVPVSVPPLAVGDYVFVLRVTHADLPGGDLETTTGFAVDEAQKQNHVRVTDDVMVRVV